MATENVKDVCRFAAEIRLETIRELAGLGFGHVGGAMSVVELLAVLYDGVMKIDPARPDRAGRSGGLLDGGVRHDRAGYRRYGEKSNQEKTGKRNFIKEREDMKWLR